MLFRRPAVTDPERRAGCLHKKRKRNKEKQKKRAVLYGSCQYSREGYRASISYVRAFLRRLRGARQRSMNLCISSRSRVLRSPKKLRAVYTCSNQLL